MLVLSRKPGETVVLNNNITVTVTQVSGNKVRLAFAGPEDVRIIRDELACWLSRTGVPSGGPCLCEQQFTELYDKGPVAKSR
jgi:carbon storage regulator